MTDQEFEYLEKLYNKAKLLKGRIERCPKEMPELYVQLKQRYDKIDPLQEMMDKGMTLRNIDPLRVRVENIREFVFEETRGLVSLSDKIIVGIIEKSIL